MIIRIAAKTVSRLPVKSSYKSLRGFWIAGKGTFCLRGEGEDAIGPGSDAGSSRGTAVERVSPDLISPTLALKGNLIVVQSNFMGVRDKATSGFNGTFSLSSQNKKSLDSASLRSRVAVNSTRIVECQHMVLDVLGKVGIHVRCDTKFPEATTKGLAKIQGSITIILNGSARFVTHLVHHDLLDVVKDLSRTVGPAGARGPLDFFTSRWESQLEDLVTVGFVRRRFKGCRSKTKGGRNQSGYT